MQSDKDKDRKVCPRPRSCGDYHFLLFICWTCFGAWARRSAIGHAMTPALAAGSATGFGSWFKYPALAQAFAMLLLWCALLMAGVGWLEWVRLDWRCSCSWLGHWSWLCSYAGLALVLELDALPSVML
jgi:hypothetical protein